MITGPDGNLIATINQAGSVTWQIANIHGDVAAAATNSDTDPSNYYLVDEYGMPTGTASPAQPGRYGALGAKQRSTEDLGGLTLMGVRPYAPGLGRFLSVDPIPGGSASKYAYPNDPINQYDLNGKCWSWAQWACNRLKAAYHATRRVVSYHYHHAVFGWSGCYFVCVSASFQSGHATLGWGQLGFGVGYYVGWHNKRPTVGRGYSMSAGGSFEIGGTVSWSTNALHTRHNWEDREVDATYGVGLWGGAGYSQTWRLPWIAR